MTPCATLYSTLLYIEVPFLLFFSSAQILHLFPYCRACIFSLVLVWHFLYTHPVRIFFLDDYSLTVLSRTHSLYPFLPQMNLSYPSWASHSSLTNCSEGVMLLPHHQAPALPLDQSCLPEESASATRAHSNNSSNNNNNNNSHHSSPTFSNTIPEFMDCVIDSVSICIYFILGLHVVTTFCSILCVVTNCVKMKIE